MDTFIDSFQFNQTESQIAFSDQTKHLGQIKYKHNYNILK